MLANMGITEWSIVLVIILIFFGSKRLPGLAQSIGKSIRELKSGLQGLTEDIKESVKAPIVESTAKIPEQMSSKESASELPVASNPDVKS